MSLRIFSGIILLLLAACGGPPESVAPGNVARQAESGAPGVDESAPRIACALGSGEFRNVCTIESSGYHMTIRHPDGGFRRLGTSLDGDISATDGAQPARIVARTPDYVEIAVADERYRLPTR